MMYLEQLLGGLKLRGIKDVLRRMRKKRQHQCPICKDYGHHWHNCKKGNPDDIAAMMAMRGPPKKRPRTAKSAQSSIMPFDDETPATCMSFPPSQSIEPEPKKKRKKATSSSVGSKSHSLETTCQTKEKKAPPILVSQNCGNLEVVQTNLSPFPLSVPPYKASCQKKEEKNSKVAYAATRQPCNGHKKQAC
ncbi:hypothetical protein BS78_07G127600 [Paspalum vaginatum]|nr:hypothetical protein BS78_07G127600 [Paspalum vaginatum]